MGERAFDALIWLLVLGLAAGTLFWAGATEWKSQPVPFPHDKHVDFGIACEACHVGAKDSVRATIPNVQTCAFCHVPGKAGPRTPGILEAHVRDMKPISWQKLYQAPRHVTFSHKRHAASGKIECKACHGEIGKMEKALSRKPVPLSMDGCMDCHRMEGVTTDCLACHR